MTTLTSGTAGARCVSFLRRARKAAGLVLAAGVLAACQVAAPVAGDGGEGVRRSGPTQVALLVPYGSARETDTQVARSLENAARLAAADLGGAVEVNVYPTQGTASGAQTATQQAIAAGAQVVLGPLYADNAAAAGVAASTSGVPVLSFSNNISVAGGNVWVLGNTFDNVAQRLLTFAASQGRNRVLVTHNDGQAGRIAAEAIARAAPGTGAQITGNIAYPLSQAGIQAAVPTIARQVGATGSNAVFLTGNTAGDLPVIAQLLTEAGVGGEQVRYLGLTRWDIPFDARTLPALQGGYFTLPDPAPAQQFEARYRGAYAAAPHPLAGLAYDGMAAIGAISRRGDTVGRTTLTAPSGFAGVGGVFRLLPDGSIQRSLAVAQIVNRQIQVVSPAPNRFGPRS
ncbi:penicillin-binding protein activator [Jannaschia seohaensis]|uniref:ABC-type branched-chain amino acid transport system, substrate-binding protein n=1 Tax=Jannaschia seohaensis TaxID=475081 RepID=A0A2Y9AU18_9RHOB|nr:penicillin-binding protein activator [Jannaschia seohaensis]PWJ17422.1 ABC-type branched-subunit amino acid transport system substrate-binding protein [Jannaschia seohaensis]SSA47485.1 ABC-type branched-chain amino acid transport system, substrate-binding protein [Jannaschia seohaensis]